MSTHLTRPTQPACASRKGRGSATSWGLWGSRTGTRSGRTAPVTRSGPTGSTGGPFSAWDWPNSGITVGTPGRSSIRTSGRPGCSTLPGPSVNSWTTTTPSPAGVGSGPRSSTSGPNSIDGWTSWVFLGKARCLAMMRRATTTTYTRGSTMGADQLLALGTATTGAGQIAQTFAGFQTARSAERRFRRNAALERQTAAVREDLLRRDRRKRIGRARARAAAFGGVEGSDLDILAEEAVAAEQEALLVRFGGEVAAQNQLQNAEQVRRSGLASLISGSIEAGTTLMTGTREFNQRFGRNPGPFEFLGIPGPDAPQKKKKKGVAGGAGIGTDAGTGFGAASLGSGGAVGGAISGGFFGAG